MRKRTRRGKHRAGHAREMTTDEANSAYEEAYTWKVAQRVGFMFGMLAAGVVVLAIWFVNIFLTHSEYHYGYLRVITDPPTQLAILVDGDQAGEWGVWQPEHVGAHRVCFIGPHAPPCVTVHISGGRTTKIAGTPTA